MTRHLWIRIEGKDGQTFSLPLDLDDLIRQREAVRAGWAEYDRKHPEWDGFPVQPNDIVCRIAEAAGFTLLPGADQMFHIPALCARIHVEDPAIGRWRLFPATVPERHGGCILEPKRRKCSR